MFSGYRNRRGLLVCRSMLTEFRSKVITPARLVIRCSLTKITSRSWMNLGYCAHRLGVGDACRADFRLRTRHAGALQSLGGHSGSNPRISSAEDRASGQCSSPGSRRTKHAAGNARLANCGRHREGTNDSARSLIPAGSDCRLFGLLHFLGGGGVASVIRGRHVGGWLARRRSVSVRPGVGDARTRAIARSAR
jgi:hypothetical protein